MKIIAMNQTNPQEAIAEAETVLRAGGLVLFPTETVYGAGVDATNPEAVKKLLAYKSRREGKPLSIAVTDVAMAEKYVDVNDAAKKIYDRLLPGPVTVVSIGKNVVAEGVESEFGTLGVRIPDYQLILDLVKALGKPITATSANGSGQKRPYTIKDVTDNLSEKQKNLIDLVLDVGELPKNPPSTVIDTTLSTPVTVRSGALAETGDLSSRTANTRLHSKSETETKAVAGKVLLKHWDDIKEKGLLIGLDGPLGVGKTIFTKGAAKFLGITETLTSPTYTYIEEYDFIRHGFEGKLYHLDVWKIDSEQQFKLLEFESLLKPGTVVIVEWMQQVRSFIDEMKEGKHTERIDIAVSEVEKNTSHREIEIYYE